MMTREDLNNKDRDTKETLESDNERSHVPPSPDPPAPGSLLPVPWQTVRSEVVADCRVFRVRHDRSLDPRNANEHDFFVIEAPDWINVVPLTPEGQVVMIEQYRHGTNEVTLEIPGGMVDKGESPKKAAARELLEETGYRAGQIELLGKARPNPAIQNNWLHTFVARKAVFEEQPSLDGSEHIAVRLVGLEEVRGLIANGTIDHALVVVAFYNLFSRMSNGGDVSASWSVKK